MRRGVAVVSLWILSALPAVGQEPQLPPPAEITPTLPLAEPNWNEHESQQMEASAAEPSPSPRFWFDAEFLLWWLRNPRTPPLVTTGPTTDPLPGALDDPLTMVRFGGNLESFERYGARFTAGYWIDDDRQCGIEASYFFLASRALRYEQGSPGTPIIAQPFFNTLTGAQDASLVTFPGVASGNIDVRTRSFLDGAEANLLWTLNPPSEYPVRVLAGFRYAGFTEDLQIASNSFIDPSAPVFAGNHIAVTDSFACDNNFFGPQLGFSAAYHLRRLEVEAVARVAIGDSHESVNIHGVTSIDTQPASAFNAGFLAVASNSGRHSRDDFAFLPEVDVTVRYQITERIRATLGFSWLYWSSVLRPGDQVDLRINPVQVPTSANFGAAGGPALPSVPLRTSDFWALGLSAGLEIRF